MARPKKEIDIDLFEKMCEYQCTQEEICGMLDITDKTLTRWCKETYELSFSEVFKRKSAPGKMSLRRYQFKQAEKNATMAIWLGKQYLGQTDNPIELRHDVKDNFEDVLREAVNEYKPK